MGARLTLQTLEAMLATGRKTHAKPQSRKDNSVLVPSDCAMEMGRHLREEVTNPKEVTQRDFLGVSLSATANARVSGFLCGFAAVREIFLRIRLRFTNPVSHP